MRGAPDRSAIGVAIIKDASNGADSPSNVKRMPATSRTSGAVNAATNAARKPATPAAIHVPMPTYRNDKRSAPGITSANSAPASGSAAARSSIHTSGTPGKSADDVVIVCTRSPATAAAAEEQCASSQAKDCASSQ